jgi:DNA-binding GntR family transcriptional regulator
MRQQDEGRENGGLGDLDDLPDDGRGGPLHDRVFQHLKKSLLVGDLRPGEAVTMRSLASRFGTSAMPVRDAIGRLVASQALEFSSSRTVAVPRMSRARYIETLRLRLAIETLATEMAVPHVDDATLAELESLNDQMEAAASDDARTYFSCNQKFHFTLYNAGRPLIAMSIIESLWMHSGPFLGLIFGSPGIQFGHDNHAEILASVRRGDARAAANAVAKDLSDAADIILARHDFSRD